MDFNKLSMYELIERRALTDIASEGYLLRHKKSGAHLFLVENDDENKVFYIGFRTPPSDSTGVPHILEHSVLCGSRKFPVKDPFVELAKGSLNTFLNAMTYPDKTVYPVASCNDKDFQNLMDIYMDAVLNPKIYEHDEIFRQEGWHYELESADSELTYNGVVYNEMKGAFSSPESVMERVILNSLFPDTTYAVESGGDPEVIPELTYEGFLDFHRRYYHPCNSYIYLYGNMDMEEKLLWLDKEYLGGYEAISLDSQIGYQKPFERMEELTKTYSISSGETEEDHTYLSYNKVIGTSLDAKLCLAFEVLDYALLSAPGAPLKKALTDAGIGKDIMGSYDDGIYQPIFSVIAKNANADQQTEFVAVIEDTLKDLVKEGLDKKALQAGINSLEFRYREADFGNYPKGLMYGLDIFGSWLYDVRDPFMNLEQIPVFDFLKGQIETGYFENLIQEWLLENQHGSIVTIRPEKGRTARMEQELAAKLRARKESMTAEEIGSLVSATRELKEYQEAEDPEEAMDCIPVLERSDISREVQPIVNEELMLSDIPVLYHEIETNGIGYINFLFSLDNISGDMIPYVGILKAVLGMIDTENYEYSELSNEINLNTGGIGISIENYPNVGASEKKEFRSYISVKGKALYAKVPVVFAMIQEILMRSKLDDTKRLKEILSMTKSRLQMNFLSAGHSAATVRALSYSSTVSRFKDLTSGIAFYDLVSRLDACFEDEKELLISNLTRLCELIFTPSNLLISYTSAGEGMKGLEEEIRELKDALYQNASSGTRMDLDCMQLNEGFKTSSKVQYVARTGNFIDKGYEYHGALRVLRVIMSYDYLWMNLRVQGGAYGCMCNFNRLGDSYFVSYRDPNLKNTNAVYEGVPAYVRSFHANDRDMTKYVIGAVSDMDTPLNPASKGERSLNMYLCGITEEILKKEREQVLNTTSEDIQALAPLMEAILADGSICVIGSEEKIEADKELFQETKELF